MATWESASATNLINASFGGKLFFPHNSFPEKVGHIWVSKEQVKPHYRRWSWVAKARSELTLFQRIKVLGFKVLIWPIIERESSLWSFDPNLNFTFKVWYEASVQNRVGLRMPISTLLAYDHWPYLQFSILILLFFIF